MKNQGIRQEKQKGFFQMLKKDFRGLFWRSSCAACSVFGVDCSPVIRPAGIRDQKEKHERTEKADQKTIHIEKTIGKFSGRVFPSVSVNLSTHGVFRQFLLTHREIIPPWVCRQPIRSRVSDISGKRLYCKNPANF